MSVIVLNFNGADVLSACLESLVHQTYRPLEVLVADNGSTDGSGKVAGHYPVRWEPLGRNHGFAHGNNLAVRRARGEVLVFVNNDMRFSPSFVTSLVIPLVEDEALFATDARQLDWKGKQEIHLATRLSRRPMRTLLADTESLLPRLSIEQVRVNSPSEVVQACAANMAVRRSMFEDLGGFDELLPAGWEDTEICWRAWLRRWRVLYVPEAVCWHRVGVASSTEAGSWMRYRGAVGGRLLFATKHLPIEDALLTWIFTLGATLRDIVSGNGRQVRRRLRVVAEFSRHVPRVLRDRAGLYAAASVSPRQHLQRLSLIGSSFEPRKGTSGR